MSAGGSDAAAGWPRAYRVRARLEAAYEDTERQVFLPTLDLSESGVFLISPEGPTLGSPAQVVLELPGHEALLRIRGTVTRLQSEPVPGFAIGFENDASNAAALEEVRRFVRRETSPV